MSCAEHEIQIGDCLPCMQDAVEKLRNLRITQLYELAGFISVEFPELHHICGGRFVEAVDKYRASIGDGLDAPQT